MRVIRPWGICGWTESDRLTRISRCDLVTVTRLLQQLRWRALYLFARCTWLAWPLPTRASPNGVASDATINAPPATDLLHSAVLGEGCCTSLPTTMTFLLPLLLLLPTIFGKPTPGDIHFRDLGVTSYDSAIVHLRFHTDVGSTISEIDRMQPWLAQALVDIQKGGHFDIREQDAFRRQIKLAMREGKQLAHRGRQMLSLAEPIFDEAALSYYDRDQPHNRAVVRHKRGFIVIGITFLLGLIASATIGSLFSQPQLKDIEAQARTAEEREFHELDLAIHSATRIDALAKFNDIHSRYLKDNREEIVNLVYRERLDAIMDIARASITEAESALTAAMAGRVHINLITTRNQTKLRTLLTEETFGKDLVPMLRHLSDISQVPASFVINSTGFTVVAHIPAAPRRSVMNLFKLIPLPLKIHPDFYSEIAVRASRIAVAPDTTFFQVLSDDQFAACSEIGNFFLCHQNNVVRKAPVDPVEWRLDDELCLYALYKQHYKMAQACCRVRFERAPNQVRQIGTNENGHMSFASFSTTPHQGLITCRDKKDGSARRSRPFSANDLSPIYLEPGCEAETAQFRFACPPDVTARIWDLTYVFPPNAEKPHLSFDMHAFNEALNNGSAQLPNMDSFGIDEATLAWFRMQQKLQQQGITEDHWSHQAAHSSANMLVLGIIVIVGCGALFYFRARLSRIAKAIVSDAPTPPAPLPPVVYQVAPKPPLAGCDIKPNNIN